jgi:type IV secretion system protein VirB5
MPSIKYRSWLIAAVLTASAPVVHAQFAVIDVAAVTQLVTEVQDLEQTLTVARNSLAQAQAQLSSMTGDRGMEQLLAGIDRNYLPTDWSQLSAAMSGVGSAYAALSAAIGQARAADSVLTPQQLDTLSAAGRQQLEDERDTAALLQGISRQALANASGRFADLQQLIGAIGTASDQKGILDLNARIGAEEAMLQNERTKLAMLVAAAQAQRWADEDQARERAISAQGQFATRFQPTP